jgi:hypothetical protein
VVSRPPRQPLRSLCAHIALTCESADGPGSGRTGWEPILQNRRSGRMSPTAPYCLGWR